MADEKYSFLVIKYPWPDTADDALRALHARAPVADEAVIDEGLAFSVDLSGGLAGWRAKPHAGVVNLGRIGHYAARDFWDEVRPEGGRIILDPGAFYILMSREAVVRGDVVLAGAGTTTVVTVTGAASVDAPIIGRQAEAAVTELAGIVLRQESELLRRRLAADAG